MELKVDFLRHHFEVVFSLPIFLSLTLQLIFLKVTFWKFFLTTQLFFISDFRKRVIFEGLKWLMLVDHFLQNISQLNVILLVNFFKLYHSSISDLFIWKQSWWTLKRSRIFRLRLRAKSSSQFLNIFTINLIFSQWLVLLLFFCITFETYQFTHTQIALFVPTILSSFSFGEYGWKLVWFLYHWDQIFLRYLHGILSSGLELVGFGFHPSFATHDVAFKCSFLWWLFLLLLYRQYIHNKILNYHKSKWDWRM